MTHPVLTCCPYLAFQERPSTEPFIVGPWQIVQSETFTGPWRDCAFEDRARQLLSHLEGPAQSSAGISLIISAEHGADGKALSSFELTALQAAIDIGAISMNPAWDEADAHFLVTSDNTEIHCWPLAENGLIAFDTGSIIRFTSGGWDLNSKKAWSVAFPIETPRCANTHFNPELASAVYDMVLRGLTDPDANESTRRLATAIPWWSKAWRNTPSITMADRVVFLNTAFEALISRENAWKEVEALQEIFEALKTNPYIECFAPETLLWSPQEQSDHLVGWGTGCRSVTALQHWYIALRRCRNTVIHEGRSPDDLNYSVRNSAYSGPFVHVGERVFREAVLICLVGLGYDDLWLTSFQKAQRDFRAAGYNAGFCRK